MKIGIFTILFDDKPLEDVAKYVSNLGYEMIELAVWRGTHHLDIDEILSGEATCLKRMLEKYNLEISALSNHLEGQLILGPHDESTDPEVYPSPSKVPEEKIKYGMERMKRTAEAAAALDVPVVNTLIGSPNWGRWYIFPPKNEELYEKVWDIFAERWGEVLDAFASHGLKLAHEVHPSSHAYNVETAERAIKALNNRREFGFNFDPSHLIWQGIDPVVFIKKFGDRIWHSHAKDCETQKDELPKSGVLATGPWRRINRSVRFRVPGWGDVDWRKVITALVLVGYNYVLSYEHEDPVMSREDGCEKCIQFLKPLLIRKPLEKVWW
jgi:sugar phosphate isomerase/epimerase